jgi:hypothetical protein
VDAFLAERGLTIMYTGKGERRDDEKKTTTRISGRERVDDHVHGEGGEKGRQKKDNDKDNDTGWEQAAACGGGSTKWLDSYLAGGGVAE